MTNENHWHKLSAWDQDALGTRRVASSSHKGLSRPSRNPWGRMVLVLVMMALLGACDEGTLPTFVEDDPIGICEPPPPIIQVDTLYTAGPTDTVVMSGPTVVDTLVVSVVDTVYTTTEITWYCWQAVDNSKHDQPVAIKVCSRRDPWPSLPLSVR